MLPSSIKKKYLITSYVTISKQKEFVLSNREKLEFFTSNY